MKKLGILLTTAALLGLAACTKDDCVKPVDKCAGDTSSVIIVLTTPPGVNGLVTISGPGGYSTTLNATDTLFGLTEGHYKVTAKRIKVPGAIVGKAYYGKISLDSFTISSCSPKTSTVSYVKEPGSEMLWVADGTSTKLHGFGAAKLAVSGSPSPDIALETPPSPRDIAFDSNGNLWFSNTEGVYMYAMEDLGTASAQPRVKLTGVGVTGAAIPGAGPLAFDEAGALWIGQVADNIIVRLTAEQLRVTGTPTATVKITSSDVKSPESLAFDAAGNLFAASEEVLRFNRARLGASITGAADAKILRSTPLPIVGIVASPNLLAFEKMGKLWVGYVIAGSLIPLSVEQQIVSDTLEANLILNAGVISLVEGLAIDEAGALWMPGSAGKIVKAAPASLGISGDLPAAVTLTSPQVPYAGKMVFNPSAEGLPLRD